MKFVFAALVASVSANGVGEDCFFGDEICDQYGLTCITYEDGQYGTSKICEDCRGDKTGGSFADSYGDTINFSCPPKPAQPAPEAPPPEEEERASSLVASAAALIAAVSVIA